jgi:hypothetical protein
MAVDGLLDGDGEVGHNEAEFGAEEDKGGFDDPERGVIVGALSEGEEAGDAGE